MQELPPEFTILAIETSCDETAAAIVRGGQVIVANVIASQIDEHRRYGGIVPEVASRQHILAITPVVEEALAQLPGGWEQIHAVAATYGPGLAGALLTGLNTAKTIAWSRDLPFVGVNHIEAHIYANWLGTGDWGLGTGEQDRHSSLVTRPTPGDPLLELVDIRFGYGDGPEILRGISLTLREGEVVAIMGPNGAGKSTLLRHGIGLLRPKSGQVRVAGQDARGSTVAQLARTVGYVFQSPSHMLFAPTVRAELTFGPRNLGLDAATADAAVPAALAQVGLAGFEDRAPLSLSFGQQKRLGIAAVLSMRPRVLVLDEPTAGQDHGSTQALMHMIGGLEGLAATVLITHDVDLAVSYATRVVLIRDGRIEADGPPEQVLADCALIERCRIVPTSLLELNLRLLPRTGRFLPIEQLAPFAQADMRNTR